MCEIMVVGDGSTDNIINGAKKMYQRNTDGVGIVAVYAGEEEFHYDVYKAETPDWRNARKFVNYHEPWRFIVHARLATAGGTGYEETHPIKITDSNVDINYVVHNGHVQDYRLRDNLKSDGHEFNTGVDSEAIAHAHGSLPQTLSDDDFDEPNISGQLHYLLLGDERILIRDGGKYYIDDSMRMSCRADWVTDGFDEYSGFRLYKPDGSFDEADIVKSGYQSFTKGRGGDVESYGSYGTYGRWGGGTEYKGTADPDQTELPEGDTDGVPPEDEEPQDSRVQGWEADNYESTGNKDVDNLQVREFFTNNPPHYWEFMNGKFVCTIHNEEFDSDHTCDECVEMIDPDDLKYFDEERMRHKQNPTQY